MLAADVSVTSFDDPPIVVVAPPLANLTTCVDRIW